MRRVVQAATTALLVLGVAAPAGGQEETPHAAAGFDRFDISAQSQAAAGYLFAVGDEEDRLAGARLGVAKPPDVSALAAAFQRGLAAGYFYAAVLGSSAAGGAGVAPEPPPGEASALYPSEPRESTWEGPLTTGTEGHVIDGRSHARATAAPSGRATFELQRLAVPDQLDVGAGMVTSRGGPVAEGVEGESTSVLRDVTIGSVLRIETLTSRAFGLVPTHPGDPVGTASTVVEGATVNGTPVRITEAGLVAGDATHGQEPKADLIEQVRQVLAAHHIEDVRLAEASATPLSDGVRATAGTLRVLYRNSELAASNPQGFAGGGFEIGGATVTVTATRTASTPPAPKPPASEETTGAPTPATESAEATPAPDPTPTLASPPVVPAARGVPNKPAQQLSPGPLPPPSAVSSVAPWPDPEPSGLTAAATPPPAAGGGRAGGVPPPPAPTRLAAAIPAPPEPTSAQWSALAFLGLGSIPLLVVLAFRLARP